MERKIISKESLANLFARDEIQAAELLRDVLMNIKSKTDITDPAIKKYNADTNNAYFLNMSLSTVKTYAGKYGYVVYNEVGVGCVVEQFTIDDYKEIKKKLYSINENKVDKTIDSKNDLTAEQRLALDFVKMSGEYKKQTAISIRCADTVNDRLVAIYKKFSIFPKQYIISHLLNIGLTELEKNDEKIND